MACGKDFVAYPSIRLRTVTALIWLGLGLFSRAAVPEYRTAWVTGSTLAHRDGSLAVARFDVSTGIAIDGTGNIFLSDCGSNTIRKIDVTGQVTTVAGAPGVIAYRDGVGASAAFGRPTALAVDAAGNLYVADGRLVRKITPTGVVTTLAGSGTAAGGADGLGEAARFEVLDGIAVDSTGNVFVTDYSGHTVRKITPERHVSTFAGQYHIVSRLDGVGPEAAFAYPYGLAMSAAGVLYLSDRNSIRQISAEGRVTTLAYTVGTAMDMPQAVTVDIAGNVFVIAATPGVRIAKRTPEGVVTVLAGPASVWASGYVNGAGAEARFMSAQGLGVAPSGDLYVADRGTIRRVTQTGVVSTFAGLPHRNADGPPDDALFSSGTCGLALDGQGNLYVADTDNATIRVVNSAGQVSTLAGSPGRAGAADGQGAEAQFAAAESLVVGPDSAIYVADLSNHAIRRVTRDGAVTTYAGDFGQSSHADGAAQSARFRLPNQIARDGIGNLYVADSSSRTIRTISVAGEVSTLAGSDGQAGNTDGDRAAARFSEFDGIAVDPVGNVYVTDADAHTIRKVTPAGVVSTIAGRLGERGSDDGAGTQARFDGPMGLAADRVGNLYVADAYNAAVRRVAPDGTVVTLFQLRTAAGALIAPQRLAVDAEGSLFVAAADARIRKLEIVRITPTVTWSAPAEITAGTALNATQLNASATTPGSFQYDPPAGTMLAPGAHLLRVAFTPTDSISYSSAAAAVTLRVVESPARPTIQQATVVVAPGTAATLSASTTSGADTNIQWMHNGKDLSGATGGSMAITVGPAEVGLYTARNNSGPSSDPAIVGVTTASKVIGAGEIIGTDIQHQNGNTFDQVLVTGTAEAITADPGQVTRTSFIDVDGDIVQVEFSGAGTLSLVLDGATGRAVAEKYNQPSIQYVTGHAGIVVTGANETTNLGVFSVGRQTAVNPLLFKSDVIYDGIADLAFIAITSTNGRFGILRTANANYFAQRGYTGIYAPGVAFDGPVYVGDISAFDSAKPVFVLGSASDVRVTGGDMLQANGQPVQVSGITQLKFTAGSDSHGNVSPAQTNRGIYLQGTTDVTAQIVVNP